VSDGTFVAWSPEERELAGYPVPDETEDIDMAGDATEKTASPLAERRWPMAVAVLTAIVLQLGAPEAGRILPRWVLPLIELVFLTILIASDPGRIDKRSRGTRRTRVALISVMTAGTLGGVIVLMVDILGGVKGATSATSLFGRGAALWVTNIIVFSLWYWALDRGGPAERAAGSDIAPSFAFPENALPEVAPDKWRPTYPDYLYLSFTNATAFSPTDTLPVQRWAKMTMMGESMISLVTAILVIARAINVLPS
jgi:uncharacterized membrane protein